MIVEHPDLQFLEFVYCEFGKPAIDETSIRVPVRRLEVIKGFPGYDQTQQIEQGTLVFEGVVSSKREITDNSTGFPITETVVDGPFVDHSQEHFSIELVAPCYDHPNPSASVYVEWWIVAGSIRVEGAQ